MHLAAGPQLSGSDRCCVRGRFRRDVGWKAEGLVQINLRRAASAAGLRLPARAGRDGKEEGVGESENCPVPTLRVPVETPRGSRPLKSRGHVSDAQGEQCAWKGRQPQAEAKYTDAGGALCPEGSFTVTRQGVPGPPRP